MRRNLFETIETIQAKSIILFRFFSLLYITLFNELTVQMHYTNCYKAIARAFQRHRPFKFVNAFWIISKAVHIFRVIYPLQITAVRKHSKSRTNLLLLLLLLTQNIFCRMTSQMKMVRK